MPEHHDHHNYCRIAQVYYWENGLAMVFCEHGEQMPGYQGPTAKYREMIEAQIAYQGQHYPVSVVENARMPGGGVPTRRSGHEEETG